MADQVEYSLEATINIGDFQNVRPGIRIISDVRDGETVDQAYQRVKAKVDAYMDSELETIDADLPHLPSK